VVLRSTTPRARRRASPPTMSERAAGSTVPQATSRRSRRARTNATASSSEPSV
jgi:hypothetical protein